MDCGQRLQFLVNNKFDFELTPGIILYDENGNYLDTLLSPNVAVPKLTQVSIPVPVNQEKIDYLYQGKKMLIWMKLNSNQENAIEAYVVRLLHKMKPSNASSACFCASSVTLLISLNLYTE